MTGLFQILLALVAEAVAEGAVAEVGVEPPLFFCLVLLEAEVHRAAGVVAEGLLLLQPAAGVAVPSYSFVSGQTPQKRVRQQRLW